jgi:hypothetical protein
VSEFVPLVAVPLKAVLLQPVAPVELHSRVKGTSTIAEAGATTLTVGAAGAGGGGGGGTGVVDGASSPLEPEPPQPVRTKSAESGIAINGYFTVFSLTDYLIRIIGNDGRAVALADLYRWVLVFAF